MRKLDFTIGHNMEIVGIKERALSTSELSGADNSAILHWLFPQFHNSTILTCCSRPDHRTNHVALAYRFRRLSVTDASGAEFSATNLGCNVVVRGLEPSIAPFTAHWNSSEVDYRLETASPALRNANLAFTDIDWSQLGDAPLGNDMDICGNATYTASVSALGGGTNLPSAFVSLPQSGSSTLLMEFPEAARHHNLYLNIYAKSSNELLFSKCIELHIGDVAQMIGWENLRSAAGGSDGLPTRLATDDWPAIEHGPGNVVFVHGYNMAEDAEAPL